MSNIKKSAGYSISAMSLAGAVALTVNRYSEFAVGAESLASWVLPPVALLALAAVTLTVARLGHPSEREINA